MTSSAIAWVLPSLFLIGYISTTRHFEGWTTAYLAWTLLASLACLTLLTQLGRLERQFIAIWLALALLILVYFVRFYWIAIDPSPLELMLPATSFLAMVADKAAQERAFELSAVGFSCFCFSAAVALKFLTGSRKTAAPCSLDRENRSRLSLIAAWLLVAIVPLMIALAYISSNYHIGEMGAPVAEALPLRLKGVVFYARTVLIPLSVLLSIYLADRSGSILTSRLGMLILLTHGVTDMLLRSSRSALLLCLLLLVFLILAGGAKLRRRENLIVAVVLVVTFFSIPIMAEYRKIRLVQHLPYIDALIRASSAGFEGWLKQTFKGVEFVLFRMPGIESLWAMIALHVEPLGAGIFSVIHSPNGVAGHLTYTVHRMSESYNSLLAPGFVGWLYIFYGLPGIICGTTLVGGLSVIGWKYLDARDLISAPVAKVLFLWMLFLALSEGNLDGMVYILIVGVFTIVLAELGLRLLIGRATQNCP